MNDVNISDDTKKQFKLSETIILIIITLLIGFILGLSIFKVMYEKENKPLIITSSDEYLSEFIENYNYIVNNYYGDLDKEKLIDSAISGMINSFDDPYTSYIDDDSNVFNTTLDGSFKGIGVEVVNDSDNNILVYGVISDSPAEKAGIKVGDIFKSINGKSLENMTTKDFVSIIKNSDSSNFEILLLRDDEEINLNVNRELVTLKSVESEIFERDGKKIGYIYISIFANNTYSQFKSKLSDLEGSGIDSLIIDVRSNTGGHLTAVENILSLFLDSSHVIYQTEDKNGIVKAYSHGSVTKTYPIVVLTNEASASASEILAAAMSQEYGAILVGKKTYGKGTVQELKTISDGQQYKFTTKKWLTPNGEWVHEVGIDVDIEVDFNIDYYDNPVYDNDRQLQSAIEALLNK